MMASLLVWLLSLTLSSVAAVAAAIVVSVRQQGADSNPTSSSALDFVCLPAPTLAIGIASPSAADRKDAGE